MNTNEIINQEIELSVEETEAIVAPTGIHLNHNEVAEIDLTVEETEAVIAPGIPLI